jgi:hypothetical protein
LVKIGRK